MDSPRCDSSDDQPKNNTDQVDEYPDHPDDHLDHPEYQHQPGPKTILTIQIT